MTSPNVDASNQEFLRYDQVEKEPHLSAGGKPIRRVRRRLTSSRRSTSVPTCTATQRTEARFAADFGAAVQDIGFSIITGHGVDTALYDQMERHVEELFTTTRLEDKLKFRAARHGSVSQGYFPIRETSDIHPDLVEGWVWCRRAFDMPQHREHRFAPQNSGPIRLTNRFSANLRWPTNDCSSRSHRRCSRVWAATRISTTDKLEQANFGMRLNYYPVLDQAADASGAGRLLGHEDVDLFTILPAPKVDGLQVWNHHSNKWVRLHAPPGSIIINTGDYMQRISNDRLPSTTHRVGKPVDGSQTSKARVSFPMAVYVSEDEILDVLPGLGNPKYEPIKAITFHTRSTSKFYGDDYAVNRPLTES